jgi:hypothetical protein
MGGFIRQLWALEIVLTFLISQLTDFSVVSLNSGFVDDCSCVGFETLNSIDC